MRYNHTGPFTEDDAKQCALQYYFNELRGANPWQVLDEWHRDRSISGRKIPDLGMKFEEWVAFHLEAIRVMNASFGAQFAVGQWKEEVKHAGDVQSYLESGALRYFRAKVYPEICHFQSPPIGFCGLHEEEAREFWEFIKAEIASVQ